MSRSPAVALRDLERLRTVFGRGAGAAKRARIAELARRRFARTADLVRFHEALCFMRAYPDDAATRRAIERALEAFAQRADLRAHRLALEDTGVAGTDLVFPFFEPTARWLAARYPAHVTIEWPELETEERLLDYLPLLGVHAETPSLDVLAFDLREWIDRMRHPRETDAAFLIRRFEAAIADPALREKLYDEMNVRIRLSPWPATAGRGRARRGAPPAPSRSLERWRGATAAYQRGPLASGRPDLRKAVLEVPDVRAVSRRDGEALIDLSRGAMVSRVRDLDAFSWADPRDVRVVSFGGGLQFACMGQVPERRLFFEGVYGYLTLRNGVPIGYVLTAALFGSAEVAYNVFETYRGAEAAPVYARALAMTRHLFGCDTFMVPSYQLGVGNDEALDSGAWWFYQKLGFRPRDRATAALMRRELARMERNRKHRSSRATLERLASEPLYWSPGPRRADVLGELTLENVGLRATALLARRFGADRERGAAVLAEDAMRRLGVRRLAGWRASERAAFERWAPVVALIPGLQRWSRAERTALTRVIRSKGGRRESDYVVAFDRHPRLRAAVLRLASGT